MTIFLKLLKTYRHFLYNYIIYLRKYLIYKNLMINLFNKITGSLGISKFNNQYKYFEDI